MTRNTSKAGQAETVKARSRKTRSEAASAVAPKEQIVAPVEISQVECEAASAVAPEEQVVAPVARTRVEHSLTAGPVRKTKKATVLGLLQPPEGVAIAELMTVTGWQAHTVRAVLTRFRNDGRELVRTKDQAGVTRYRLNVEA